MQAIYSYCKIQMASAVFVAPAPAPISVPAPTPNISELFSNLPPHVKIIKSKETLKDYRNMSALLKCDPRFNPNIVSIYKVENTLQTGICSHSGRHMVELGINRNIQSVFHATSIENLKSICIKGIDIRMSASGNFGHGFYGALGPQGPFHANKFSKKFGKPDEIRVLLYCKVLAGNMYVVPKGEARRNFVCEPDGYQSVLGELSNGQELVIYNNNNICVTHFILYQVHDVSYELSLGYKPNSVQVLASIFGKLISRGMYIKEQEKIIAQISDLICKRISFDVFVENINTLQDGFKDLSCIHILKDTLQKYFQIYNECITIKSIELITNSVNISNTIISNALAAPAPIQAVPAPIQAVPLAIQAPPAPIQAAQAPIQAAPANISNKESDSSNVSEHKAKRVRLEE